MNVPRLFLATVVLSGLLVGCDQPAPPVVSNGRGLAPNSRSIERGQSSAETVREQQAAFLNRIRQSDPQFETIQKAVLNEQNELGLVLNRNVDLESIRPLMRTMLTQMAKEFPGQDLTVVAYAPANPPMKIGTARLDAQTRQMSYTPAR
jgi:hypothetical protein